MLAEKNIDDDFLVTIGGAVVPRATVSVKGKVLAVDVEKAWSELGLKPGWNNEVTVEVFVNW